MKERERDWTLDDRPCSLDRLFPRIPIHPFMMLLLQLNKVWRRCKFESFV